MTGVVGDPQVLVTGSRRPSSSETGAPTGRQLGRRRLPRARWAMSGAIATIDSSGAISAVVELYAVVMYRVTPLADSV